MSALSRGDLSEIMMHTCEMVGVALQAASTISRDEAAQSAKPESGIRSDKERSMKKGRGFQIFGSLIIAYIIWNMIMSLGDFPVLSYRRIYVCIACILMIVNAPVSDGSGSGTAKKVIREEWVIDNNSRRVEKFIPSKYPRYKLTGRTENGNIYSSDEGELLFTEIVKKTVGGGEADSEDWVTGWAYLILFGCIASFIISGIVGFVSREFADAKNGADDYYASEFEDQSGGSSDSGQELQQDTADEVEEPDTANENDYESEEVSLTDYGIYTDGRGISDTDYVMPDSNSRKLTESDIDRLTLRGINYAKNELFARHGRKFKSQELQRFFNSRSWYYGYLEASSSTDKEIQSNFNSYEKYNCDLLYERESSMGMYKLD